MPLASGDRFCRERLGVECSLGRNSEDRVGHSVHVLTGHHRLAADLRQLDTVLADDLVEPRLTAVAPFEAGALDAAKAREWDR